MRSRLINPINRMRQRVYPVFNLSEEMASNRTNIMLANCSYATSINLAGGNFFTGLLLLLNATDTFIGLVTMISLIGNMLQVLSPLLLERFESRKKLMVCSRIIVYAFNIIIIGIIPLLGYPNEFRLMTILCAVLIINLVNAMVMPGFAVWHIKSIPENVRQGFFSLQSIVNNVVVLSIVLGVSKFADYYKGRGAELEGLLIIRGLALVLAVMDLIFLLRIKEYPNAKSQTPVNLKNVLISPFKEKKYMVTVLICFLWSFCANVVGPYFGIFLLKDLKVEYTYLNLCNMLYLIAVIFLTPMWAKRIERTSPFKTLYRCMGFYMFHLPALLLVGRSTLFLYPVIILYAFTFSAGINLLFASMPYHNIPEGNQTNYIGFYSTMANVAAFLGISTGNIFIGLTEGKNITFLGVSLQNKQYILVLGFVIMCACTLMVRRLSKREETKSGTESLELAKV